MDSLSPPDLIPSASAFSLPFLQVIVTNYAMLTSYIAIRAGGASRPERHGNANCCPRVSSKDRRSTRHIPAD